MLIFCQVENDPLLDFSVKMCARCNGGSTQVQSFIRTQAQEEATRAGRMPDLRYQAAGARISKLLGMHRVSEGKESCQVS